jgi:hypothetical protein
VLNNGKPYYNTNLEKAAKELCWEKEIPTLLALYNKVVQENF